MSPQVMAGANMGIGMIGSLFSGIGQAKAGQAEQKAYDYNASVAEQNAASEMVTTEQRYSQIVGKQAAAYAASGVDITQGSPLLMMAITASRGGRQQAALYQAGQQEATLDRYYGRMAAWRGRVAGIQSFLSGMSKSVTGYLDATGYMPKDERAKVKSANSGSSASGYTGLDITSHWDFTPDWWS